MLGMRGDTEEPGMGKTQVRHLREGAGNVGCRTRAPAPRSKERSAQLPTYGCARLCSTRPQPLPALTFCCRARPQTLLGWHSHRQCDTPQWRRGTPRALRGVCARRSAHRPGPQGHPQRPRHRRLRMTHSGAWSRGVHSRCPESPPLAMSVRGYPGFPVERTADTPLSGPAWRQSEKSLPSRSGHAAPRPPPRLGHRASVRGTAPARHARDEAHT